MVSNWKKKEKFKFFFKDRNEIPEKDVNNNKVSSLLGETSKQERNHKHNRS